MLKSKAIDIIKTFSPEEFKRFEDFVRSPYFNKSASLIKLTAAFKKFYPSFDSPGFTEEHIYSKVFGKNKYSYGVMRNLMSDYLSLCDSFLIAERNAGESKHNMLELMDEYQQRDLFNLYFMKSKKFKEELENMEISGEKYRMLEEFGSYEQEYDVSMQKDFLEESFSKRAVYNLCFILNLLYRDTNNVYSSFAGSGRDPDESMAYRFVKSIDIESFVKTIKTSDPEEKKIIQLFLNLISMIVSKNSNEYYYKVKNYVLANINSFSNKYKFSLLNFLRNYTVARGRLGTLEFQNEHYEIICFIVENIDFSRDKIASSLASMFEEIVILSVDRKRFDYAQDFMNSSIGLIDKRVKDTMFGYCDAYLNFGLGNFHRSLEILSTLKPVTVNNHIRIKHLFLKCYYELDFIEEGFSVLDAYRHYIVSAKLVKDQVRTHKRYINIFTTLFKFRSSPGKYNKSDINDFIEELKEYNFVHGKAWFFEKPEELISSL